jgi:hypothetical protein
VIKTDYLEDLGAGWKILLKLILNVSLEFSIDFSGSCETLDVAVDRILWVGVLCLVTWCMAIDCSSIEHLSECTRNAP